MNYLIYVIRYTKTKLLHSRFYAFFFIILITCLNFQQPLRQYVSNVRVPCSIWVFPFLMARDVFSIICYFSAIYVNSDIPFMQNSNMYHLARLGRRKWIVAQLLMIFFRSFAMVLVIVVCSIITLLPNIELTSGWGRVITTLASVDYSTKYNLKYGFYYASLQSLSPLALMSITIIVLTLILTCIGLIMFCLCLYTNRIISVFVSVGFCLSIFLIQNVHPQYQMRLSKVLFPIWSQIAKIYTTKLGHYYLPSISYMMISFCIVVAVISVLIIYRIKKMSFIWEKETY